MGALIRILGIIGVIVIFGMTVEAVRVRSVRAENKEAMRVGFEDVARRVRTTTANLATVMDINNRAAIAKARAFARIVEQDPSIVSNQTRFAEMCKTLDVEELHVSDGRGIIVQTSSPETSMGFDLHSAEQPRPFLQAITDKSFELVQKPLVKPQDGRLFQFAGVARLDEPGVVQVALKMERVAEAMKLADVNAIAASVRIGRTGRVEISDWSGSAEPDSGIRVEKADGECRYVLDGRVGTHLVRVLMPVYGTRLGDDALFTALCLADLLIALLFILTRLRTVSQFLLRSFRSLAVLFGGVPGASFAAGRAKGHVFRSRVLNPLTLVCAVAFVLAAVLSWLFYSHSARLTAEDNLTEAMEVMYNKIEACVNQQLFHQAHTICRIYGSPEKITNDRIRDLCKSFDLDELNVIDERGVIIAANDPALEGFDMGSKPVSAQFNRLLKGDLAYGQPFRASVEDPNLRCKYIGVAFPLPAKGYVQLGFSEARLKDEMDYWFAEAASDWQIGKTGFYVIAKGETGEIDSCGKRGAGAGQAFVRGDTLAGIGFDTSAAPKDGREFFEMSLYGESCLCLSAVKCYHRIIAAIPLAEIYGGSGRLALITVLMLFTVFVLVAVFMTRLSELVSSLKGYIAEAARRAEKEMAMATAIQTNVLPSTFPPYPNLVDRIDIYALMLTAKEVGGDFYDFFFVSRDKLALVVADVSGKGVPAALFMMRAKATLQGLLKSGCGIAEAVGAANDRLADSNEANMFVTAWIGVVDLATGKMEYVNAGHNPPLVKRAAGTVEYLVGKCGPPLAAMSGVSYRQKELVLSSGEGILLYTDGVTEAVNPLMELYGEERLLRTTQGLLGDSESSAVLKGIERSVRVFANGAEQADDITMLAFKLK